MLVALVSAFALYFLDAGAGWWIALIVAILIEE